MGKKIGKDTNLLILLLISLVLVGFMMFSNVVSFSHIQTFVVDQLRNNQLIETQHASGRIENHLLQAKDEMVTLSKFPEINGLSIEKCQDDPERVHEKISSVIGTLLHADKEGNIIACTSPQYSSFLGLNIRNKDYFTIPQSTKEPYITGLVTQGRSSFIVIAVPLFESSTYTPYPNFNEQFTGVLLTFVDINDLYNLYIHPYLRPGQNSFLLIDKKTNETLLSSPDINDTSLLLSQLPTPAPLADILSIKDLGDTIMTTSDIVIGHQTLRLIVLTPVAKAAYGMESLQTRHLVSLVFIIIVSLFAIITLLTLYRSKETVEMELQKANITLERFGITAHKEEGTYSVADTDISPGKIYLITDEEDNHAHELFLNTLNRGYAGLGIVRENPSKLKKRYNLDKTSFIWLTKVSAEGVPTETNIDVLFKLIHEFITKSDRSVILIDRIDYLILENSFDEVARALHALHDLILDHDCIIIIAAQPKLLTEDQLSLLSEETEDPFGKQLGKITLSELEKNILAYINEGNISNKLVTFKHITSHFSITKPTTRVKISRLAYLGLVMIEQQGRYKSLRITSSGRKLLK
ncbi:DUF835 domain-containing protein [Candidatus Woesearchaeota archaeon]|nr:MAG: hypothetical protein QS99_C0001G0113 [archaeon GW2011_AR4]MBS3129324.1 DUF835 domain-containing protein [Candidatus Woesearchaeota archaeon]HIH38627.1 DUF835 domain-containing protein [Candidatus Woesearchaeota archaeon]HIH49434.1 DUF835 domain-containing protein [Candidatus Woesearchaeota archaeon]HIJ02831.1 DUF835 domain-containing protein [Candidatus Woesearchaeota archaeon]